MLVVKIGGSVAEDSDALLDEVAERDDVVLVHGFGPQTDAVCRERGIEVRTIVSPDGVTSRFTDEPVLDAMRHAARAVQNLLLDELAARDADPIGLGHAKPLLEASAKPALRHQREDGRVVLVRGNRSGAIARVDAGPVERALADGRSPVVTPLAIDDRGFVSVDADRAAAALAGALGADGLALFTDVDRVLDADGRPVDRIDAPGIDTLLDQGAAQGGMVRKLVACREALEAGVPSALVASAARSAPLAAALDGDATEVVP